MLCIINYIRLKMILIDHKNESVSIIHQQLTTYFLKLWQPGCYKMEVF